MLSFLFAATALQTAPPPTLAEFLRPFTHDLTIADTLKGPGADVLYRGIGDARFVCIGEEHFIREVPQFSQALFTRLNEDRNFQYLVVENDPYAMRVIGESTMRKDAQKIRDQFLKPYPNMLAFAMPPEIDFLASVYRTSKAAQPIWGLDQNIGALHILERLEVIAPSESARAATKKLIARVKPIDSKRAGPNSPHYMSSPDAEPDIKALKATYAPKAGSEAAQLFELMELSASVYAAYWRGAKDATANFHSNANRESYIKQQFAERYRTIASKKPKMLLKFGMNHVNRGVGISAGWYSFGNFISELAIFEGTTSVHVAIMANAKGGQYSRSAWARELQETTQEQTCVIDLRAVRVAARSGQLTVSTGLLNFLDGFDFAVLVGNPTPMPLSALGRQSGTQADQNPQAG